jgi:hypothetical protein
MRNLEYTGASRRYNTNNLKIGLQLYGGIQCLETSLCLFELSHVRSPSMHPAERHKKALFLQ